MLPSHRILDKELISLDPLFQHYSRSLRSVPQAGSQFPSFQYPKGFLTGKAIEL
jgi:hypothetical protein